MVDVVLYFEGTRGAEHRILRAAKNRVGSAQEVGLFTMTGAGLVGVEDPSEVLLSNRGRAAPGAAVTVTMEGSRPLLVEVQALCAESTFGSPQRVSTGVAARRLAMLLAVLEKGTGVTFGRQDVFLNVAGGVRLGETAADLAVCTAILSSARGRPVAHDTVVLGEVGLTGELRPVPGLARRLAEAARLGFERALIPDAAEDPGPSAGRLRVTRLPDIGTIAEVAFA
jgi:DNA repair protein RadA/Sms